ncbi:TPA: aldehyde dehydrogenase [Neisseria gonorrhoeae]
MKQLAMYINGRFENDFNGEWRDVLNPSTEETIAREPKGGRADVDRGATGLGASACGRTRRVFA